MNKKVGIVIASVLLAISIALIIVGSVISNSIQKEVNKTLVLNADNEKIWSQFPKASKVVQKFVFYSGDNVYDAAFDGKEYKPKEISDRPEDKSKGKYDFDRNLVVKKGDVQKDVVDLSVKYDAIKENIPEEKFSTINLEALAIWNKLKTRSKETVTASLLYQQLYDLETKYYFQYLAEKVYNDINTVEEFKNKFSLESLDIGKAYTGTKSSFDVNKSAFLKLIISCKNANKDVAAFDEAQSKYQINQNVITTIYNKIINNNNDSASKFALNQFQGNLIDITDTNIYGKLYGKNLEFTAGSKNVESFLNYKLEKDTQNKEDSLFLKSNIEKVFDTNQIILKNLGLTDSSVTDFKKFLDELISNVDKTEIFSVSELLNEAFEDLSDVIGKNLLIAKLHKIKEADFTKPCVDILSGWTQDKTDDTKNLIAKSCKAYDVSKISQFTQLFKILLFTAKTDNLTLDEIQKLRKLFDSYINDGIKEFFKNIGVSDYDETSYRDYSFSKLGFEQLILGDVLKKVIVDDKIEKISDIFPELSSVIEYKLWNKDTKLEVADLNKNFFNTKVHYDLLKLYGTGNPDQKFNDEKYISYIRRFIAQHVLKLQTKVSIGDLVKGKSSIENGLFSKYRNLNFYKGGFPELPEFTDPINVFNSRYYGYNYKYFSGNDDIKSARALKSINNQDKNIVKIEKSNTGIANDVSTDDVSPSDKAQEITKVSDGFSFEGDVPSQIRFLFTPIGSILEASLNADAKVNFFKKFELKTFNVSPLSVVSSVFFDVPLRVEVDPSSSLSVEKFTGYTIKSDITYSLNVDIPEDFLFPKSDKKASSIKILSTTFTLDYTKEEGKILFEDLLYNKLFSVKTIYFFGVGLLIFGLSLLIFFILSIRLDKEDEVTPKDSKTSLVDITDSNSK